MHCAPPGDGETVRPAGGAATEDNSAASSPAARDRRPRRARLATGRPRPAARGHGASSSKAKLREAGAPGPETSCERLTAVVELAGEDPWTVSPG